MKIEVLKQFSVLLPNKPGALNRLAQLFSQKGINILGLASEVRDDSGIVRIAVDPKVDVSAVLSQAGFASVETRLLSVEVDDEPGELFWLTQALAEGGINITTVYGTAAPKGSCRILIATENTQKARLLLESLQAAPA
jgi:hypothetical protein